MNYKQEIQDIFQNLDPANKTKVLELRQSLVEQLRIINKNLRSWDKSSNIKSMCPHCYSINIKNYGKKANRAYCLDCNRAYVKARNPLHYNKRYPNKVLDLIVLIYTTENSKEEIVSKLEISFTTYYKWRKEIIAVFPQLEEKFKNRLKTR